MQHQAARKGPTNPASMEQAIVRPPKTTLNSQHTGQIPGCVVKTNNAKQVRSQGLCFFLRHTHQNPHPKPQPTIAPESKLNFPKLRPSERPVVFESRVQVWGFRLEPPTKAMVLRWIGLVSLLGAASALSTGPAQNTGLWALGELARCLLLLTDELS